MAAAPRIIVVGGGLAGLASVIKIAEAGGTVDLFSIVPVKRSHSVCAQGGINAAKDLKGEGDTVLKHFDDTVYGGDFLANQTPVKQMTAQGPAIVDLLVEGRNRVRVFEPNANPLPGFEPVTATLEDAYFLLMRDDASAPATAA